MQFIQCSTQVIAIHLKTGYSHTKSTDTHPIVYIYGDEFQIKGFVTYIWGHFY